MINEATRENINKWLNNKTKDEIQEINDYIIRVSEKDEVKEKYTGKYYCFRDKDYYSEVFKITKVFRITLGEVSSADRISCEGDIFIIDASIDSYPYNILTHQFKEYSVDFLNEKEISEKEFLRVAQKAVERMLDKKVNIYDE